MKKVLSVGEIIKRDKKHFVNSRLSSKIIHTFFQEIGLILQEGNEIRFPRKKNGKLFLATVGRKNSRGYINRIQSPKGALSTVVKPILIGFDVNTIGRVKKDKKLNIRFSYPQRGMIKLQATMKDDFKRRKLPEIE